MKGFKELFKDFENKCIDDFQYKRASLIAEYNNKPSSEFYNVEPLFHNDDLSFYRRINYCLEYCLNENLESFIIDIFQNKGYKAEYRKYYINEIYTSKLTIGDYLVILGNYQLGTHFNELIRHWIDVADANKIKVCILFTCKNTIQSQNYINKVCNYFKNKNYDMTNITICTISDFIGEKISEKYKEIFDKLILNFEKKLKDEIGYQITEICNNKNMKKFRNDCKNIFLNFTYEPAPLAMPTEPLNQNDFNMIYDEFINKEKYKIMLSDYDFSDSFITSEWLFEKYKPSEELDNTCIVAGYLKSLEQLLTTVIWKIGKGKKIRGLHGIYEIDEEKKYKDSLDCTLGNLTNFIFTVNDCQTNTDLFLDNFKNKENIMDYLKEQLNKWVKNYRNGYFHKDNLKDITKVKEIRDETIYLYFMILGSFKINSKDF